MYPDDRGDGSKEKKRDIPRQTERLITVVEKLESLVIRLSERLTPIMKAPCPRAEEEKKSAESPCVLSGTLSEVSVRVGNVTAQLEDAIERLEI